MCWLDFGRGLMMEPCNQTFSQPNSQKVSQSFPCSPTSCDCSITMATIIYSVNSSGDQYLLPAGSTLGLEFLEEFGDTPVRSQRHLLCCFKQLLDLWLLYFFKRAKIKFSLHANQYQQPAKSSNHQGVTSVWDLPSTLKFLKTPVPEMLV